MSAEDFHSSPQGAAKQESTIISQLRETIDANATTREGAPSNLVDEQGSPKKRERVQRLPDGTVQRLVIGADGSSEWSTINPEAKTSTEKQVGTHEEVLGVVTGGLEKVEQESSRLNERIADLEKLIEKQNERIEALVNTIEQLTSQPAPGASATEKGSSQQGKDPAEASKRVFAMPSKAFGTPPAAPDAGTGSNEKDAKKGNDKDKKPGTLYKGNPVSIARTHMDPSDPSKVIGVDVVDEHGQVHRASVDELTYAKTPEAPKKNMNNTKPDDEPAGLDMSGRAPKWDDSDAKDPVYPEPSDAEKEADFLARGLDMHGRAPKTLDSDAGDFGEPDEPNEEVTQSRLERVKGWFKKQLPFLQGRAGNAWWEGPWKLAQHVKTHVLNFGITDEMSDEEKEHKRERTRVVIIAGGAALAGGALAASGFLTALAVGNELSAQDAQGFISMGGGDMPDPNKVGGMPADEVENLPLDGDSQSIDMLETPTADAASIEVSDPIPAGGGGEKLFKDLGMEPATWYENEKEILERFPKAFYPMKNGHVGIQHAGPLPEEVQNFIKSLQ